MDTEKDTICAACQTAGQSDCQRSRTCLDLLAVHLELASLKRHYHEMVGERDVARNAAAACAEGSWIWAGDDTDDLDSMSSGMVVTMTAGTLRELLWNT